jgi:hypothetical protein
MRYTIVSETNHPIVDTNIFYLLVVSPGRLVSQKCSDTPRGCQAPPGGCQAPPGGCQAPPISLAGVRPHRKIQTGLTASLGKDRLVNGRV